MSGVALSNPCARILLDAALFSDSDQLAAQVEELRPLLAGRELLLLYPGSRPASLTGTDLFADIIDGEEDESLRLLDARLAAGALTQTLLLSDRERLLSWARKEGLAVLIPAPGERLAQILDPGELVLRDSAGLILRAKRRKEAHPFLIGVNGINKSGKTRFSERLVAQLERLGFETELLSLEIFTAPKRARQAKGYAEAERLLHKHYQMERLQEQLLAPLQTGRAGSLTIDVYDPAKERVVAKRSLSLDRNSMLCLEGPFLFQEDLFSAFDFRIYLVSDFERAMALELGDLEGKQRQKRQDDFVRRELAAQSLYLRKETPWKRAQLVIRGMNSATPRIETWQSEL